MEQLFYTQVDTYLKTLSTRKNIKYLTKTETYNQVIDVLKGKKNKCRPQFKFWGKKKFYTVKIGAQDILHSKNEKLPVVTFENLFDRINECHNGDGSKCKNW